MILFLFWSLSYLSQIDVSLYPVTFCRKDDKQKEPSEYANWMSRARARDEVVILARNICWCSPAGRAASPHAGPIFCSAPLRGILIVAARKWLRAHIIISVPRPRDRNIALDLSGYFPTFPLPFTQIRHWLYWQELRISPTSPGLVFTLI